MSDMISPRIYVGAGGSGRRMVALLKQAVESDPTLSPDEKQAFQFLAVDADEYQSDCKPLNPHSEYLHISGFRPAAARKSDYLEEAVRDWWIDSYTPPYIQQGAGAVRLIGRLCYFYHYPRIRDAFLEAVQRATGYSAGRKVSGEVSVYIIGSLAGGTGSSMFLDLAHLARRSCNYRQVYVNGVVVLPDVFTVTQVLTQQKFKDRWMANGYAALKELVYFNEHPKEFKPLYRAAAGREEATEHPRMFDQCLFIEPVLGSTSTVVDGDDMFRLAAQSVYLYSASAHGAGVGSVLVNTDGIHYASLGMQSIVYPHEYVMRFARHWGTARLLEQLAPDRATLDEERGIRDLLAGDLQTQGWAQLEAAASAALAQLSLPEPVEIESEADLAQEINRAIDRYKLDLRPVQDRLTGWSQGWAREFPAHWEAHLERLLAEGRSLAWVNAYLQAMESHFSSQLQRLEGQIKQQTQAHQQEENKLKHLRGPAGLSALIGGQKKRAEAAADAEDRLEQLFAEEVPQRLALEAAVAMAREFLSQWLQPRLHRLEQLRSWATSTEIQRQEEVARRVARELDEVGYLTPHTHFSIQGKHIEPLVKARLQRMAVGSGPLAAMWRWVNAGGTAEARGALLLELEEAVGAAVGDQLHLTLMESWKLLADPGALEERFRAAALTCKPFWSYVEEQAGEHMTRVSVLALPPEAAWDEWLKDLRMDIRRVEGDPFRVIFLTVEGCRAMKDVHLKELPEWFRTYEKVQRTYDYGTDERPLHVHRHWQGLPEVDPGIPYNVGALFGPAEARGLITRGKDGHLLRIPAVEEKGFSGEEVRLGLERPRAMQALVDLHEPAAGALREWMKAEDRKALRNGFAEACFDLQAYVARIRSEGRLENERRALVLQTEAYLQRLRQKKYGMSPETETVG